jgi:capsular polysaccharide biosynthesis protein
MPRNSELNAAEEAFEGASTLYLRELLGVLRRRLWLIGLVAIVLMGGAVGISLAQTPKYEASIKILVGQEEGSEVSTGSLGGEVQGLQQITQTLTEGVNSRPVTEAVIQQLGLQTTPESFEKNLNAEQVRATQFIQVHYTDTSPERAQQVVDAVGDVFSEQVSEVSPSANAVTATVWERAALPDEPVSPKPVRNGLLALAAGVMIGVALTFLIEYLDNSWRSPEEVEQVSGLPTFGIIPEYEVPQGKKERR